MKTFTALIFLLSTLIVGRDAEAQTRGPRYNPNPGSGRPRNPGYRGGPSRPSPRYGSSYDGGSHNGSRDPGHRPSRPDNRTPRQPRFNPYRDRGPVVVNPVPSTPSYRVPGRRPTYGRTHNSNYRPIRTDYGTRYYHRPFGYSPVRYVHYEHAPYRATYYHTVRYNNTYDWYNYVWRSNPNYVYAHWIFWPATGHHNGYWTIDDYPYYVYNGYRYRYSAMDYCNYQLVDKYDHHVIQTYWNQLCNSGYDACSYDRDRLNSQMSDYRYFCSETYRDYSYDYSKPSYEDSYYPDLSHDDYYTCTDSNRDGMCDDDTYTNNCSDDDYYGYCDSANYSENG